VRPRVLRTVASQRVLESGPARQHRIPPECLLRAGLAGAWFKSLRKRMGNLERPGQATQARRKPASARLAQRPSIRGQRSRGQRGCSSRSTTLSTRHATVAHRDHRNPATSQPLFRHLARGAGTAAVRGLRLWTLYAPEGTGRYVVARAIEGLARSGYCPAYVTAVDHRRFLVNPSEHAERRLLLWGTLERGWVPILRRIVRKGDVVVDVGANIGWYTTLLARLVGRQGVVLALEPVPRVRCRLAANVANNGVADRVRIFGVAAGDHCGTIRLWIPSERGLGSVSAYLREEERHCYIDVPQVTLDCIVANQRLGKVALIKIDVEGHELEVIEGAKVVIAQSRPFLLVEVNASFLKHRGMSPALFVRSLCDRYGMDAYGLLGRRLRRIQLHAYRPVDYENVLLVPNERQKPIGCCT